MARSSHEGGAVSRCVALLDPCGRANVAEIESSIPCRDLDGDALDGRPRDEEQLVPHVKEQIRLLHERLQAFVGSRALPKRHLELLLAAADEADRNCGFHGYLRTVQV